MGKAATATSAFDRLTGKQKAFVVAYMGPADYNATRAALLAKYKPKAAYRSGAENLHKPQIIAALAEAAERAGITAAKLQEYVAGVIYGADLADFEGILTGGMSLQQARQAGVPTKLIKKIKVTRRVVGHGEDAVTFEDVQMEVHDPLRAVEIFAKLGGMLVERHQMEMVGEGLGGVSDAQLRARAHAAAPDDSFLEESGA